MQRIVSKAIAKERGSRYQSSEEFATDLRSFKQKLEFEIKLGGRAPESFAPEDERSTSGEAETLIETPAKTVQQAEAVGGRARATGRERSLAGGIRTHRIGLAFAIVALFIAGLSLYFVPQWIASRRSARRADQAIEQYRKTLEIDENFGLAHFQLGQVYAQKGMYQEAIAEYQKAKLLYGDPSVVAYLGHAYAMSGKRGAAQKILDELMERARQSYVSPDYMAIVYLSMGDKDHAFEWLEKAYEARASNLIYLKVDPVYDSLRQDPRFRHLLRRMNLPER